MMNINVIRTHANACKGDSENTTLILDCWPLNIAERFGTVSLSYRNISGSIVSIVYPTAISCHRLPVPTTGVQVCKGRVCRGVMPGSAGYATLLRRYWFEPTTERHTTSRMLIQVSNVTGSEYSSERKFQGATVPGPFRSGERKGQGANWPGSYWPIRSWATWAGPRGCSAAEDKHGPLIISLL